MNLFAQVLAAANAGYVAVGWLVSVALIGAYAFVTVRRGRRLSAQVPPEDRRWS